MNKLGAFILPFILSFFSSLAWSHTDQYFDSVVAPHGGQMRMAGPYHMEIVAKDKEIVLYITDHANVKVSVDEGIAKATVQNGKAKTTVKLQPKGNNLFRGKGNFIVTPKTKIMVFVKLPGQDAQAARFTPLKVVKNNKTIKNSNSHVDSHDEHKMDQHSNSAVNSHDHHDEHKMDQHSNSHDGH
tara:strand:+ start:1298 stop:1852 length:555 start_codon:yes stop_codon:yes gene_type:complete